MLWVGACRKSQVAQHLGWQPHGRSPFRFLPANPRRLPNPRAAGGGGELVAGAALMGAGGRGAIELTIAGYSLMGLGISFGPAIGYSYAGEPLRGWGIGLLRLAGFGVGSLVFVASALASICDECHATSSTNNEETIGLLLVGAVAASAFYDIVTSLNAARRTNASHGLSNVALVPVVVPGGVATSHGLALAGRF